jgi:sugar lactone lactonase YvrE
VLAALGGAVLPLCAYADPVLLDPAGGVLELVTPASSEQAKLNQVDDLLFDPYGNLLATREISGANGAVVAIDIATGTVSVLVTGISRADQIARHPSGDYFVTSEVDGAATSNRIFRVRLSYDANQRPISATATSITTSIGLDNPEGIVALPERSAYGEAGDLFVAQDDAVNGRVAHLALGVTTLFGPAFLKSEGLTFGSVFGQAPALFVAESNGDRVARIDANGVATTLGDPAAVSLQSPDNAQVGPDGLLYVSEDRGAPLSRVFRILPSGTHRPLVGGLDAAQGLAFDPATGDLYIAEQGLDRVWRVRFAQSVPALGVASLGATALGLALAARCAGRRARAEVRSPLP